MLATNVAETSRPCRALNTLSIPVLRVLVATATAPRCSACRSSRFPASANQRKGRCGRVSEGSVFVFIQKTISCRARNLPTRRFCAPTASVILQMTARRRYRRLPFVEAPDKRNIGDGVRLLEELGAITTDAQATAYNPAGPPAQPATGGSASGADGAGGAEARLRAGSDDHHLRAVDPDPRERPMDKQQASDENIAASTIKSPISSPSSICGTTSASSRRRCRRISSAASAGSIFLTICACASGRTSTPSCAGGERAWPADQQ